MTFLFIFPLCVMMWNIHHKVVSHLYIFRTMVHFWIFILYYCICVFLRGGMETERECMYGIHVMIGYPSSHRHICTLEDNSQELLEVFYWLIEVTVFCDLAWQLFLNSSARWGSLPPAVLPASACPYLKDIPGSGGLTLFENYL